MKAAAMDPARLAAIREGLGRSASSGTGANVATSVTAAVAGELLAGLDAQAARADEAEARNAAVIAVMRGMEKQGVLDAAREALGLYVGSAGARLATSIEWLRVALGLPSEWRDGGEG